MIRFLLLTILLLLVARAFWRLVDGILEASGGRQPKVRGRPSAVKLARDPVCGTFVAPASALTLSSGGTTHYFCSEDCRRKFKA